MSNGDIVTVMLCVIVIIGLLAYWGWLPECNSDDSLVRYYRGDDLKDKR